MLMHRRLFQLFWGLGLYGFSMALMLRADLGLDPWDVLHQGLAPRLGLSFGMTVNLVGAIVLLLWWPLRKRPGLGTVCTIHVIETAVGHRTEEPRVGKEWGIRLSGRRDSATQKT